jgi:hypothetical protein
LKISANFAYIKKHLGDLKMRSFAGRDILSLKDFEREEFFHVFEVADEMAPIAKSRRNSDLLAEKTMVTAFTSPAHAPVWLMKPPCTAWADM